MLDFVIPFIILILVVVFIHEYGHYYFARKYGVGVTDFSIGFGKELFGWNDNSGTRWKICLIPLGGYVKLAGMIDESMDGAVKNEPHELMSKPVWAQIWVMSAGVIMNILLAFIIFTGLAWHQGIPTADNQPIISTIEDNSPANDANLLPGDKIIKVNDNVINIMTKMKLEQVGLAGFNNLMPYELSGGMKKRAGLARAMAMDPKILFFDEPSAGLDPIVADGIDNLILKISKAFHTTMVIVTHDLKSAFKIADRITLLYKGKILVCGTPDEIKASKDERVMNFLSGKATEEEIDTKAYLERLLN